MIKVVFFDIDETLILHNESSQKALRAMCRQGAHAGEYVHYYHQSVLINPQIKRFLKKYSQLRLGIISNGYSRYQKMKLKGAGILQLFELGLMFFSIDLKTDKSKKKIWNLAERKAKVKPYEILMIGNDPFIDAVQPKIRGWESIVL